MSEQPSNLNPINNVDGGFNFALFLTPPRNPEIHEVEESLDKMTLGLNLDKNISSLELSKHPSELKNYINKDLLQKLEDNSPLKTVMSSKTRTNTSIFDLNNNNDRELETTDYALLQQGSSQSNNQKRIFDYVPDDKHNLGGFEIKPIKMNLLEEMETKDYSKRGEDEDSLNPSMQFHSKYSSLNSPGIFQRDFKADKKSFTAENKPGPMMDNQVRNSMFSLPHHGMNEMQFNNESPNQSKGSRFSYQSNIFNPQNNSPFNIPLNNNYQGFYNPNQMNSQLPGQMGSMQMNYNLFNEGGMLGGSVPSGTNTSPTHPLRNQNQNLYVGGTNNKNKDKKKKVFEERAGDWVCMRCKNLNFSFRIICNRCKIPKVDSEKLHEDHMRSLYNYVRINEMYQNQVLSQPGFNIGNNNYSSHFYNNQPSYYPGGSSFGPQVSSNLNCNNLNVYSKESLNNGNGYN